MFPGGCAVTPAVPRGVGAVLGAGVGGATVVEEKGAESNVTGFRKGPSVWF